MKYRDDICRLTNCVNLKVCLGLCGFMKDVVNNQSSAKEVLLSNLVSSDNLEFRDYKETLAELAEDRAVRDSHRREKLAAILSAPNTREKFIKLALMAGFTQKEVSIFFKLTPGRICQIIKKGDD